MEDTWGLKLKYCGHFYSKNYASLNKSSIQLYLLFFSDDYQTCKTRGLLLTLNSEFLFLEFLCEHFSSLTFSWF